MIFRRQPCTMKTCPTSSRRVCGKPTHTAVTVALFFFACFLASGANSGILRVALTGDGTDGLSWNTAFTSIGNAITAAATGDNIWVASGTYNEAITLIPGVSLFGGFAGNEDDTQFDLREWSANKTIIDATGLNSTVVKGASYTVVDGFTVTHGRNSTYFYNIGGGFLCLAVLMRISNCRIVDNAAVPDLPNTLTGEGGGIYANRSNLVLSNCSILDNWALGACGGGLWLAKTNATIVNCIFDDNYNTAVFSHDNSNVRMLNCTFGIGNRGVGLKPGDIYNGVFDPASFIITGCIIRSEIFQYFTCTFSNIPNCTGNGNVNQDPQWVDPENGDYRLKLSSPCIDSGSTTGPAADLDGNSRPVDVLGVGRDGPGAYDMGCYEFQLPKADLNSDGQVNAHDLFLFEDQWHSQ